MIQFYDIIRLRTYNTCKLLGKKPFLTAASGFPTTSDLNSLDLAYNPTIPFSIYDNSYVL